MFFIFSSVSFVLMMTLKSKHDDEGVKMNIFSKVILTATVIAGSTLALANTPVNQQAVASHAVNQTALVSAKVTVKQASALKDNSRVQLTGHVVKALGDEKYQFRDSTGTITVDIDDELWQGKALSATAVVTLLGEVDIDYKPTKRVEIDVEAVKF